MQGRGQARERRAACRALEPKRLQWARDGAALCAAARLARQRRGAGAGTGVGGALASVDGLQTVVKGSAGATIDSAAGGGCTEAHGARAQRRSGVGGPRS